MTFTALEDIQSSSYKFIYFNISDLCFQDEIFCNLLSNQVHILFPVNCSKTTFQLFDLSNRPKFSS